METRGTPTVGLFLQLAVHVDEVDILLMDFQEVAFGLLVLDHQGLVLPFDIVELSFESLNLSNACFGVDGHK